MWLSLLSAILLIFTVQAQDNVNTHPQADLITTRSVTIGDGPFFVITYIGFDGPEGPQMMEIISKAARIWAAALDNPVQVNLKFQSANLYGNPIHGIVDWINFFFSTYSNLLFYLRNQDNQTQVEPWQSMVDTAESFNTTLQWGMKGQSWMYDTISLTPPLFSAVTGNLEASATSSVTILIDAESLSLYDFDPTDGTAPGKYDFLTTILHLMAHPLGCVSVLEFIDKNNFKDLSFVLYPWDMLRFSHEKGINISTSQRNMDPAADHHYYWDGKLPSSIELSTRASHWINRNLTDVIGIMDPSVMDGQQIGISPNDLSVMDAIGWKLHSPMIPLLDWFILNTNSSKPSVKVMGYLMSPSVVCAFNGATSSPVKPSDKLASNTWRGVTCPLPGSLKFYNKKIYVQVSNDGTNWSPRLTLWDPLVTAVLPLPIPLLNLTAPNISVIGREVFLKGSNYSIMFEAIKFSTVFINSSALNFTALFSSKNAPSNNKKYLVAVMNSTWTSNQIEISFQYPPVITSASIQSEELMLTGKYFGKTPSCEYKTPSFVTPATSQDTGFTCALPSGGVTVPFGVRVLAGALASNWFTVVN